MNVKQMVMTAAALAIGAAAGYFAKTGPTSALSETDAVKVESGSRKLIDDAGAEASIRALRRRISELEARLAEAAEKKSGSESAVPAPPPESRESHSERMARIAKEDPVRYAQMTNRFASWRRHRAAAARSRIDFLSSIDTSRMSASARAVHDELQELVAEREELEANLHQEGLSDEDRRKLFEALGRTGAKMHELSMKERDNLLAETVRSLGFEGEDAGEIVTTVKEVIKATDSRPWHRGFGRGGGRSRAGR